MHDLHQHYDVALVALSYVIAVLGSFTALQLALNIPLARTSRQQTAAVVFSGAVMGGGAIWAMHFIAMLACNIGVPVHYNLVLTIGSAILAIAACSIGLGIVAANGSRLANLSLAGTLMGIGVAGMHYLGIAAMVSSVHVGFGPGLVTASVVIAIAASIAALWLAFNLRGTMQMAGSALVMGIAVCGMHYTGMAAMTMTRATASSPESLGGISGRDLGMIIATVVIATLLATLALTINRNRSRAELQI
jgi:NO-binding membrane sensor protein with MHYT domain